MVFNGKAGLMCKISQSGLAKEVVSGFCVHSSQKIPLQLRIKNVIP